MRPRIFASAALLGATFLSACTDASTAPEAETAEVNAAVRNGERLSRVVLSASRTSVRVGQSAAISAKMYFSRGGTLPGGGFVRYASTEPCVAAAFRGGFRGIKAGTALIIGEFAGKSDTVKVTVTGSGNTDPNCEKRYTVGGPNDESNGSPAGRNTVKSGEKMTRLVLFAPKGALRVGSAITLVSEMWYNRGGRYNAVNFATYRSTNPSVASVATKGGKVTARAAGTTKVISRLGQFADTVLVRVTR
jgi:hypothetical protein